VEDQRICNGTKTTFYFVIVPVLMLIKTVYFVDLPSVKL